MLREMRDNGNLAVMRKPITKSIHPVVTVHPVTKQKALFVNSSYTQSVVGWDDEESGELDPYRDKQIEFPLTYGRLLAQIPLRPHQPRARFRLSSAVRARHGCGVGPTDHAAFANLGLSGRWTTTRLSSDATGERTNSQQSRRR
jgi:hypothetical protein